MSETKLENLDFNPLDYPHLKDFKVDASFWVCPWCLINVGDFYNYCDNENCSEHKRQDK